MDAIDRARPTPDLLIEHVAWMRALARSLVRDAHGAEDLAQDAAIAALDDAPTERGRWRAWIRSVMKHRASERARTSAARAARELERAAPERVAGADQLVQRAEIHRRVAESLLALDEPYRTTLLLRFFEDLEPRAIAARTDAPIATVKSRLQRGLSMLRGRLDRSNGGRDVWMAALAPLASPDLPATGALILGMKTKAIVGVITLVAGVLWWRSTGADATEAPAAELAHAASDEAPVRDVLDERVEPDASRAPRDERTSVAAAPDSSTSTRVPDVVESIVVRALDASGVALSGHALRVVGTTGVTRTDGGGRATVAIDAASATIESAEDSWVTVRSAQWRRGSPLPLTVVAAVSIDVAGTVVGEWGEPIAGARVELAMPDDFARRFSDSLAATVEATFAARTDEAGAFALRGVPAIEGALVRAACEDREPSVVPAPAASVDGLRIVLASVPHEPGRALVGRVLGCDGSFAAGARVALGLAATRTDESGSFALDLARSGGGDRVVAADVGSLPGWLDRPANGWPDEIEIVLGGPSLAIEGRVVDARGEPKPGARVWIDDPTPFGAVGARPVRLEFLIGGAPLPSDALKSLAEAPREDGALEFHSARPARAPDALIAWVACDADGRFELRGLADREYVLRVLDPELHYAARSAPIAAGRRGVRIELPHEDVALHRVVRGRVVTRRGDPVADVSILPFVTPVSITERVFGGTVNVSRYFEGRAVRSRADGSFELVDVPRADVSFQLSGDGIAYAYASVEDVVDPADHRFVVAARVQVEITLADPTWADTARAVDEHGAAVEFLDARADGYSDDAELVLGAGRSGAVVLPSDAVAITLWKAGALVETIPVRLVPGEVTRIAR